MFVISLLHRTITKTDGTKLKININQAHSEYKHLLTFRVRRYMHLQCIRLYAYVYVVIATKQGAPPAIPPKLHPGTCNRVGIQQGTDRHTDGHDHYTFRVLCDSHQM